MECVMRLLNRRMKWILDVEQQPLPPEVVANFLSVESSEDLGLNERASSESLLKIKRRRISSRPTRCLTEKGGYIGP